MALSRNLCKRIVHIICLVGCLYTIYLIYVWRNAYQPISTTCMSKILRENITLSTNQSFDYENWLNSKLLSAIMNQLACDYKVPDLWNLKANIKDSLPSPQHLCPIELCKKDNMVFDEYGIWNHLLQLGINITLGGDYIPPTTYGTFGVQHFPCHARERLAILVPYRDRPEHLALFLNYMHTFLPLQRRSYRIYLLEQVPGKRFDRAKLFNAGLSVLGLGVNSDPKFHDQFDCFAFHDVDKVPSNLKLTYSCIDGAYQLVDTLIFDDKIKSYFYGYFLGATLLDRWSIQRINGLTNSFDGWGGEDDDLKFRLQLTNHNVVKPIQVLHTDGMGTFYGINHHDNKDRKEFAKYRLDCHSVFERMWSEGLRNVDYKLISFQERALFTHLLLEI